MVRYILKYPKGIEYFEAVCGPRQIIDEDKIKIPADKIARIIKEIFSCSICLGIFREPVNIKSCLHKFCKKCIEEYNRRM